MKVYPKYKSSGVDLIGDIPSDWVARRLASFGRFSKGSGISKADLIEEGIPTILYGDIYTKYNLKAENIFNFISQELASNSKLIDKGDLLFTGSGETREDIGKCVTYNGDIKVYAGGDIIIFSPKTNNHLFLAYSLSSNYAITVKAMNSRGDIIVHIYASSLRNIYLPIPSLAEQQQIVNFLDYKTGECDRFIGNRQKQIELLNEQKAAIINKAVTKGINPNAKMKPSGIDWIGDIPEHWECMKIKRLSVVKRGASPRPIDDPKYFDENGEFAWVRIADVTASERYLENTTQRLSKLGSSLSVKMYPNDFFLSIAGSVGKPIITKIKCCIHDGFVWFPYLKINHEFLYYLFSTGLPYQGLGKFGTQLNLNTDTVGDIFLPIPTADEMTIIVSFIDNQTQKIDYLISKYQKQIELMQEYRTALISQAVTGKIDVRDWKPQTK